MADTGRAEGLAHVRTADAPSTSCTPWWSAFHARADVSQFHEQPPSCRDFTRVERNCDVLRDERTGRDMLHCHETREKFRLCSDRVEKLATTSIDTREPLLDGHTVIVTRSWEQVPPAESSNARIPAAPRPLLDGAQPDEQPSASGRRYRPWHARADDGGGSRVVDTMLAPGVGQAVEEIMQFADEMQRDLAQQGVALVRRGEEQQRRRGAGFLSRIFGGRWTDESRGGDAGPHSA